MSLKSLIANTISNETSRIDGIAEDIKYIYKDGQEVEIKTIIEYPIYEEKKNDRVIDSIVFHGLRLDNTPDTSDTILYNNKRYMVTHFKEVAGVYDVYAQLVKHRRGK